jgi:hypothetical protein
MGKFDRVVFTRWVSESVESKATREAVFELLDFALKNAYKVEGGKDNKTFHYVVFTRSSAALLFYCSSGDVQMYLGNFPQLTNAQMSSFLSNFRSYDAFKYVMRYEDPRNRNRGGSQGFSIAETLVDHVIMKRFKSAVLKLQDEIAKA